MPETPVRAETKKRLLALNRAFYDDFAQPFAYSRAHPQPGFERLLPYIPSPCQRALDVGCGEGRFGRFLQSTRPEISYVGVDFSAKLLNRAREALAGAAFYERDVSREGSLEDLGAFGLVVSLAVLQHVPGRQDRVRLLQEMGKRLTAKGRLIVSTWQFLHSERQRAKIADWRAIGLEEGAVEKHDYLLTWRSGGFGLRYVAYINRREIVSLAEEANLQVIDTFRSDGLEGDLNLYTIMGSATGRESS